MAMISYLAKDTLTSYHAVLFMMVPPSFHTADKFCDNQFQACSLSASITHAYWHLFVFKKALLVW